VSAAPSSLVIATRASRLALWQAEHVRGRLAQLYPSCDIRLLQMTTRGDRVLDRSLSKIGGKGLFVKELETALLDRRADLAVHSLKDVPVDVGKPFALSAILDRDEARDALVCNDFDSLEQLPAGSVVGTSSLRRESQLRARYPQLKVLPLRGNLDTRLAKLDRGDYAAIILAAAGLRRLGLSQRIRSCLALEESLPAPGQGALGIEIRADRSDIQLWLKPLASPDATACGVAERAVSKALGGSCQVPLAAYAQIAGATLHLRALVAEPDGSRVVRAQARGSIEQAAQLGHDVAQQLLDQGARAILAKLLPAASPAL
jgi:hydroxymethylbilane synthase